MKDEEKILSELRARANDPAHAKDLLELCRALFAEFEGKMSQGVTSFIVARMTELRRAYNSAHDALMHKMDLKHGDDF